MISTVKFFQLVFTQHLLGARCSAKPSGASAVHISSALPDPPLWWVRLTLVARAPWKHTEGASEPDQLVRKASQRSRGFWLTGFSNGGPGGAARLDFSGRTFEILLTLRFYKPARHIP